MNKEQARRTIKNTFESSFDKIKFINFAKDLLNQYDESKAFHLHGCYIPDSFKNFIKIYERVGTYVDPEGKKIDILIVYLKRETTIDRARTAQRNFIARYLKERGEKDAGLIAFVSPQGEDWRFSFVKMEYKFEKTPKGDVKVKEEFTPARRYSFLVGKNESSHTAQSCFVDILINDTHNLKLNEIEEAFNIEKVTKEFYEKYRNLFFQVKDALDEIVKEDEEIRKEFQEKGVNVVDFSKKLLGQIVFLYFLQKKGWFGVKKGQKWGSGSKHFLRELFEKKHCDYKNFFNDILEPLFYEALRNDRSYDDHYFSYFNCKIPFLNGGLFDPLNDYNWAKTDILLSNILFSNKIKTKEGDIGTGILDFFDRYNFTVKEDEPLEKEVAVDPEMLGKVFENLLEVKRLESSFYAFRQSINRFIYSYEKFIEEFDKGNVYVSKKYINKIFEFLENDNDEAIQKLMEEDKAIKYLSKDFDPKYRGLLEKDLKILREIQKMWSTVDRDPKLLQFLDILSSHPILRKNKLIVFTESKETADYLNENLQKYKVMEFTGGSSESTRRKVIENFDPKAHSPRDDFRILISTEVLSEGVNLHKSNVVINYDIPWNPTRMMQRAGRINRVDTNFDKIYTFNFFPSKQSNDLIKLKEAAAAKIHAFITLLGNDARLLTENEEIESYELFNRLTSKEAIIGEDEGQESDLKYLKVIKDIREDNPDLFAKIKFLPKKARTARIYKQKSNSLLTYFRKGKLQKFFMSAPQQESQELDFITTAEILEAKENTKREKLNPAFYPLLEKNKEAFEFATQEEPEIKLTGGRDSATQVLKILKAISKDTRKFTEEQEDYLKIVIQKITEGALPKQTTKILLQELNNELKKTINPLTILAVLQKNIAPEFLKEHLSENAAQTSGPREVILSEYLIGE